MRQEEIIRIARQKLKDPYTISSKYFVTGVFTPPESLGDMNVIKLVEFEKVSENGILKWKYKSIV